MFEYIVRRLLAFPFILLGMASVIFCLLLLLPGDPARLMAGPGASAQVVESIRQQMGFDQPIPVQFVNYLSNLARGDLGRSFQSRRPVLSEILILYPKTILLALVAELIAVLVGVILGILAATRHASVNYALMVLSVLSLSLPLFWLALLLQLLFSVDLRLLPPSGYKNGLDIYIILPAITLAIPTAGYLARVTNASLATFLNSNFVRTARGKGLKSRRIIFRHVLPNAVIAIASAAGTDLSRLFAGILIVEAIFGWPGIGKYAYDALSHRDFPALIGAVLFFGASVLLVNLAVDVFYGVVNPRIRYK
ncbi:MAG: ABC transporter permease [Rhodospirillales bacterium]|nr:ABC transporter permease [Rhodospirillales bacterium]